MVQTLTLTVKDCDIKRIDAYLTREIPAITRSQIKNLIENNHIVLNDTIINKAGTKIKANDIITVVLPDLKTSDVCAQDIPLDIIYEDEYLAVINKPQGMVTHPAPGHYSDTLVNAALHNIKDLSGVGGEIRPGIVHRLDKDTSGLIIIAKNNTAHLYLSNQISSREVKKEYLALLHGNLNQDTGIIKTNIGRHPKDRKKMAVTHVGREAITRYEVIKRYGKYTLVKFNIETGRTHQIRVHAKYIGHPVVGDATYTRLKDPFNLRGQLLHAVHLVFKHPKDGAIMDFSVPIPQHFQETLLQLDGQG